MKNKEAIRAKNSKKAIIPVEKLIDFNTIASQANGWNKIPGYNLNHRKFIHSSTARTMNTEQEL